MRITAHKEGDVWVLRTPLGNPVGHRLLRASQDKEPPTESRYNNERDAKNAALSWNIYLLNLTKAKR